ncbi:hypothetical protein GCM10008983_01450 [Lentibacillus halophilus]|uniref:SPOR domain-containing protein n=1 Tax=Lentibacillus halophilus TaxID=295065 RepID=A0ABN0Z1I8_9BACI
MGTYKIVAGTTDKKGNAQHQYNVITKNNMDADIQVYQTDTGELYCVEVGPYSERKQLLQNLDKIKGLGITNAFITNA